MEVAIRNTENSFIGIQQLRSIINGEYDEAAKINFNYVKKKSTYEFDLIVRLIEKYKESLKSDCQFSIETEVFKNLEIDTKSLITEFQGFKNPSEIKLREIRIKSREFIKNFIKRFKAEFHKKNVETTVQDNYNEWKNKLCECVNIWDLFSTNGLVIKFPFKYLVMKRFFIKRSKDKQNKSDSNSQLDLPNETIYQTLMKLCKENEEDLTLPRGIIRGDSYFRMFFHFLMFFLLLYTYLTMPVVYIMEINISSLSILEKIVTAFFFYDMIFSFRTAIKDKANNWVFDIPVVGDQYIYSVIVFDAIASIPFNLMFDSSSIKLKQNLRFVRSLVKIFRISQIYPAIIIVEKIRGFKALVRLFKLIFSYLLIAHWLATVLFANVDLSINYSTLERVCYSSTNVLTKRTLKNECRWTVSIYNASYLLIGQYTSLFKVYQSLNPPGEYFIMIVGYLIGQFMIAYVYAGVASIILNLNQAQNFFIKKVEMLNEHMSFYGVSEDTQNDVKTYYNYLWQKHKDIIYSKTHFDLLTESLREKFEKLNLPTNEAYLGKFYKLNISNTKMIGQILMNLKKLILYPYEILYEEKSVTKGLYILLNGEIEFFNIKIPNMASSSNSVDYASVIKEIEKYHHDKQNKEPNLVNIWDREDLSNVFPILPCLIQTGRNYQRCYSKDFTDLLFLPIEAFDDIVFNFPVEMHIMKHNAMVYVDQKKLFDNETLFQMITTHSSRSVGSRYEKEYNKHNLWIPIPIPISQRKIAKNYFSSFITKVKNQYREIIITGDINITLNGFTISNIINKSEESEKDLLDTKEDDKTVKNFDPVDDIKEKTKKIVNLVDAVIKKTA